MAIKPVDPNTTISVVWPGDPSFRQGATMTLDGEEIRCADHYGGRAPQDPGCWREVLERDGPDEPTEFVIGIIPPFEMLRIEDDARLPDGGKSMGTIAWESFKSSLRGIRNGPAGMGTVTVAGQVRVDPEWIESTFHQKLIHAAVFVGFIAYQWNQRGGDDTKN